MLELKYEVWLAGEGRAFDGGCARLLEEVERTGPVRKATAELGMSND